MVYYNVWELPPSNATRLLFMEQVLVPKLDYDLMLQSARLRGLELERITKMDLVVTLGECFGLEVELQGDAGHQAFKASEELIKVGSQLLILILEGSRLTRKEYWFVRKHVCGFRCTASTSTASFYSRYEDVMQVHVVKGAPLGLYSTFVSLDWLENSLGEGQATERRKPLCVSVRMFDLPAV